MIGDAAVIVSIVLLWLLVVVEGLLILGLARQVEALRTLMTGEPAASMVPAEPPGLSAGSVAPDFVLQDTAGSEVRLGDYRGRPLLLVVAGATCGSCSRIVPALNRLAESAGVDVLVAINTDVEGAAKWAERHGLVARLAADRDAELAGRYNARVKPFAFAIDESGVVERSGAVPDEEAVMRFVSTSVAADEVRIPVLQVAHDESSQQ